MPPSTGSDAHDRQRALALGLGAVGMALPVVTLVLATVRGVSMWTLLVDHDMVGITSGFLSAAVGAVIVRRGRATAFAWLLVVPAISVGIYNCARQLVPILPPSVPGWEIANWLALWTNLPALLLGGLEFFVFPDGRLPTRRWRRVVIVCAAAAVVVTVLQAAATWPARVDPTATSDMTTTFDTFFFAGFWISMATFALSIASLIARYRGAGVTLRQQITWVLWSQIVSLPLQIVATVGALGAVLELLVVPISFGAIAIAILRHRLFDIDRLVSRTVVYSSLTAFVVGAYTLGVLVVGQAVSGGRRPSSAVVAATTLAIAAAFQPLRRRLQDTVDRRFYRRRYDAVRAIESFALHLRGTTDADGLRVEISAVLTATMRPSAASLWLPHGAHRSS